MSLIGSVTTSFGGSVEQRFAKLLGERIEAEKIVLAAGQLPDFAAYKQHVGRLWGLEEAHRLMAQAIKEAMRS